MRVIAGKCKSLPLKTVEGMDTRPTTDRIKETLFNMLQPDIPGSRFLDLFGGSGGIGIEALSRGASYLCVVEQNKKACKCIQDNLRFTKLADSARLMATDVRVAIRELRNEKPFDIIFMDPPYKKGLEMEVLELLADAKCVDAYTTIIAEASLDTDFSQAEALGYEITKYKKYKTNAHVFLRRIEA